jgi:quercetin dioxygenase-like cupin family protein
MKYSHKAIADVPLEPMSDVISRRLVYGEKAMLAHVYLKKGAVVPEHHHENEQITWILEGALHFHIDGDDVVVKAGETLVIPSNMPHSATALEDTVDIDIFAPPRQDWINKDDEYLRRGTKA